MKIRFVKNVLVDVLITHLDEIWDKQFQRWDELRIESIHYSGKKAEIRTAEGNILLDVPIDTFEAVNPYAAAGSSTTQAQRSSVITD